MTIVKKRLPRSLRKFIRQEKARLRRESSNQAEADEKISELVSELNKRYNKPKTEVRKL